MKVFLIILAVLVVLTLVILSLSVGIKVEYDGSWSTIVRIVFIEKEVELSKLLSFILFPEKAAQDAIDEKKEEKVEEQKQETTEDNTPAEGEKEKKPNFIAKIWDTEGVVGIMLFVSNLLQTASAAVTTLFKGLHIHSLCVNMIIGGSDAAEIANDYGTICGIYYPIKGFILNGMRIDKYEDNIESDFIAPSSEYYFYINASLNVRLVLRMLIRAGFVFLKNFIKNK